MGIKIPESKTVLVPWKNKNPSRKSREETSDVYPMSVRQFMVLARWQSNSHELSYWKIFLPPSRSALLPYEFSERFFWHFYNYRSVNSWRKIRGNITVHETTRTVTDAFVNILRTCYIKYFEILLNFIILKV